MNRGGTAMENGQEFQEHKDPPRTRPLRVYVFGLLFIAGVAAVTMYIVKTQRRPGQMNLIESQAMDMKAMKAPVGSTPVALETLTIGEFEPRVTYSGSVVPFSEEEVFPRVEGWIDEMTVYAGDEVAAGQVVARLSSPDVTQRSKAARADSDSFSAAALGAQAEAAASDAMVSGAMAEASAATAAAEAAADEVAQMRQMVKTAEAELKSMKADLEYRDGELARMKKLYDSGAISKSEYEQERAMNAVASADVDKAEAELEAARRGLESMKKQEQSMKDMARARAAEVTAAKAMARAGQARILSESAMSRAGVARASAEDITADYLNIRSKLDGVVTERLVSPGTLARPGVPILRIADISIVRLQANVSEADAALIKAGYAVRVTTPRKPGKTFNARVTAVFPASNTTTRTAVVEAVFENKGRVFLPGDFITMSIGTGGSGTALSVPESAVIRWGSGGKPAVWTAVSGGAKGETLYTCVMHPEIIRKKPGDCPKCNMALVKKKAEGNLTAHLVHVELGATNGDRVKIVRGVHPGDQVVVEGGGGLSEGDALFPVKWGADGPASLPPPPGTGKPENGGKKVKPSEKKEPQGHDMNNM
jgi:multidrug efflux pump subunit AcrA (membrane-fusion protein)